MYEYKEERQGNRLYEYGFPGREFSVSSENNLKNSQGYATFIRILRFIHNFFIVYF